MKSRRDFIKTSFLAAGVLTLNPHFSWAGEAKSKLKKFEVLKNCNHKI